ncbi:zinc-ribbon domain-containing protein [uncultured Methanobrevibacter sp.]|uniref:zinc-ribbon domain-containing protein n=1 Tax=uncultured Methanobrevibacter sp. TaxID=253161 RepID=UPI0025F1E18F|nr:zinc-ribbon domain-containing protein [uncultured Methanobrevibacter sp.]
MKKCAECGKENIDKAIYCANCGAKLDTISKNSNSNSTSGSVSNKSSSSNSGSSGSVSNNPNSSVPPPALNTLKRYIANDSSSGSSNRGAGSTNSSSSSSNRGAGSTNSSSSSSNRGAGSSNSSSSSNSTINKKTGIDSSNLKLCCCYVPVILFILFIVYALIFHGFAENFPISYGHSYEGIDLDGDGKLSFNEASQLDPTIPKEQMTKYFNEADTNSNGFLKGHEFELFYDNVNRYYNIYGNSSSDNDKYKYSSSSSSSSNNNKQSGSSSSSSGNYKYVNELNDQEFDNSSEGYLLTCPYCGSEAVYETGGHYKCAECGNSIYNPDDLELAYDDGYIDLLSPIFLFIS